MKQILLAVFLIITVNFCSAQTATSSKTPTRVKYNIHLKNDCNWLLASSTKWIEGYVVVTPTGTEYLDVKGNVIKNSDILGYNRLQRRHYNRNNTALLDKDAVCAK